MRIAILGASGNIGRSLAAYYSLDGGNKLFLFGRSASKIASVFDQCNISTTGTIASYDDFSQHDYDIIINCIGISDPGNLISGGNDILKITEEFDNLVISYISSKPQTKYIFMSSGAVYGTEFSAAVNAESKFSIAVNNIPANSFYSLSKLYAEAKHRSLSEYNIVDIRVFGFVSKYVDIESKLFISDLANSVKNKKVLNTGEATFVRDYVSANEIAELINCICQSAEKNFAVDVLSARSVEKFQLLDGIKKEFNVDYEIDGGFKSINSTGNKNLYYSAYKKAEEIGYKALKTSLEIVLGEFREL